MSCRLSLKLKENIEVRKLNDCTFICVQKDKKRVRYRKQENEEKVLAQEEPKNYRALHLTRQQQC